MFFARDRNEWRVYTDSGEYEICMNIDDIGDIIRRLILSNARIDLVAYKKECNEY